ncbi:BZ3500-MvSof-1268-A1-R1-Chr11-1g03198 protein [Mycena venus]|uniref:BZ3500-MvSof-1268-A1-R1-Chr11-1g03198 protein n=1 Tax=Mycena venus TaxID=2733690 RepID=A0A8H6YGS2_9AGAR|nr:BZ3500-MvSof-1268-A1-R1-Chr11-1g03198 protein [Mycena venus]
MEHRTGSDVHSQAAYSAFCDAIRAKKDWYHKILDPTLNLGAKWAVEAGLAEADTFSNAEKNSLTDKLNIVAVLEELRNEAKRIVFFDYNIRMDAYKEPESSVDIESFDDDILASLKYAAGSEYGVRAPDLREEVGVFISDDLVPASLHCELMLHLDALAEREPPDLHPGSYGRVQDLIHPSLYPFVLDETPLNDSSKCQTLPESTFEAYFEVGGVSTEFSSRYAWIPSVFNVSDDGKDVRIGSYINGLGPREHFPQLYRLIEKVFLLALPHFKKTMQFEYEVHDTASVERWKKRMELRWDKMMKRSDWEKIVQDQAAEILRKQAELDETSSQSQAVPKETEVDPTDRTQFASDDTIDAFSFKGQQLKVIVKAANYQLKVGQTYEGTWHMEGMPHEKIVASVIYYYETDPAIVDEGLNFRKGRDPAHDFPAELHYSHDHFKVYFRRDSDSGSDSEGDDAEDDDDKSEAESDGTASDYPSDWEGENTSALSGYISLGWVPTTNFTASKATGTGRMLSFPNWLQHQVGELSVVENTPNGYIAKRKILCFFLVEDGEAPKGAERTSHGITMFNEPQNDVVLTSSDLPSQQRMTNIRTLRFLLPFICQRVTGQNLPAELVQRILEFGYWGFTREDAERHRRSLMKDRVADVEETEGSRFSLCEH